MNFKSDPYRLQFNQNHTTKTVRNKWEKLELKGEAIYDTEPCWKYEENSGSPLGSTS